MDAVGRQLSEVRRKPVESFVLTKQDNDRLIDAHFTDRPVLKLYLRYHTSISEFPNQEIVTSLRKKKNLNEETSSDLDVIAHWDLVSMGIREQMRIRGSSRADLELLEQIKKFHYQSFVQLVNTDPLEINKWLVAIFNTLQKRFPSYEKKLIKNAGSDFTILPKTTETIAAMMCHAIVHNKLPTYDETVALMADVNQGPYELSQLRDATQELYVHNEELARRDVVSELKDEQSQLLALMVDRVIDAIEYPKG